MDSARPLLDPISRLSEIMFGLLMTLTFTGSMSVALGGGESVRSILLAALGCNIAWGIVDGVMSILTGITERNRTAAQARALRLADPATARDLLRGALPEGAAAALNDAEADRLVEFAKTRVTELPVTGVGVADLRAAVAIFALVVLATFPPILPFLFAQDVFVAMRLSNAVAVCMLFVIGLMMDREMGPGHVQMRIAVPVVGVILVVTTIALGG
jgi:VIT1/CCC1 family predicted Fe2+/Mn2+ transporter